MSRDVDYEGLVDTLELKMNHLEEENFSFKEKLIEAERTIHILQSQNLLYKNALAHR